MFRTQSIWNLASVSTLLLSIDCCWVSAEETASSLRANSPRKVEFQQGVNGYAGTVDTEIWALATKTILNANPNASSDANNDGGESQVMMRFDGIFGPEEHQVPLGSTIVSAKLIVSAFDQGTTVNLHRMLVPFGRAATWDSMVSGVSADGLEASRHKDGFTFGKIAASTSGALFDVTDTVQIWANGRPNHGWVFLNTGGNGWDFYVSEFDKIEQRPRLVIEFHPPAETTTLKVASGN
ncbi:MAG: DNRLRE domain-containing protein [Planctomycetales bacterium]|nr:DNRLRE domain-containing protein [Planctomycetales bacterium]